MGDSGEDKSDWQDDPELKRDFTLSVELLGSDVEGSANNNIRYWNIHTLQTISYQYVDGQVLHCLLQGLAREG